jgi:hypothetical protein
MGVVLQGGEGFDQAGAAVVNEKARGDTRGGVAKAFQDPWGWSHHLAAALAMSWRGWSTTPARTKFAIWSPGQPAALPAAK